MSNTSSSPGHTLGPYKLQRHEPSTPQSAFQAMQVYLWSTTHIHLHYWNDQTIESIGAELGLIKDRDVDNDRIRINGLQPLEMKVEISLPSVQEDR